MIERLARAHLGSHGMRDGHVWLWGVAAPFIFDVKGGTFDASVTIDTSIFVQILIIAISAASSVAILAQRDERFSSAIKLTMLALGFYLCVSILVGLTDPQQTLDRLITVSLPAIIFCFGMVSANVVAAENTNLQAVIDTLASIAILDVIARIVFVIVYLRADPSQARYLILSSSTNFSEAFLIIALFIPLNIKYLALVCSSLFAVVVSLTRTQLLCIVVPTILLCIVNPLAMLKSRFGRRVLILFALTLMSGIGGSLFDSQYAKAWSERLFSYQNTEIDLTTATRLAEDEGMLQAIFTDPVTALLGKGIAKRTTFAGYYAEFVIDRLGPTGLDFQGEGFGHNNYISLIYTGGLIFGGFVLFALFRIFGTCLSVLKSNAHDLSWSYRSQLACWGAVAALGFLVSGLFSGTFGNRGASLWFGIAIGLATGANERALDIRSKNSLSLIQRNRH